MTKSSSRGTAGRRRRRMTTLFALPLAGLLALTGCTSGANEDSGDGESAARAAEGGAGGDAAAPDEASRSEGAADADAAASDTMPDLSPEHLIRTASLTVLRDDVAAGHAEAVALAQRAGGYVGSESTDRDADGDARSTLTLLVPQERYEEVLSEISGLGELVEREVNTEDVTDQVVDVESRIATQEESVRRVRALMDEAESISDIVALETELSTRQADLEALRSQQESLRGQTAMATITLELREPQASPRRDEEEGDESAAPSIGGALSGGWHAFVTSLAWAVAVVVAVLPFAVTLLLLALVARALRQRMLTRSAPAGPEGPTAGGE
ncbi:DUF4349 domain-containing protein [Streptomyces sp. B6B3]|uniref:DUF4349 domain-containing protein n=1 Tax=Streptomyces sp. B6B3 TaxID=3153570 RepID=UPI00325E02E8